MCVVWEQRKREKELLTCVRSICLASFSNNNCRCIHMNFVCDIRWLLCTSMAFCVCSQNVYSSLSSNLEYQHPKCIAAFLHYFQRTQCYEFSNSITMGSIILCITDNGEEPQKIPFDFEIAKILFSRIRCVNIKICMAVELQRANHFWGADKIGLLSLDVLLLLARMGKPTLKMIQWKHIHLTLAPSNGTNDPCCMLYCATNGS